jgi:hypothetical protein
MHAMETKYTARFGTMNLKATIHSSSCSVVANPSGKHFVCFPVEGTTAREAAEDVYTGQDFAARGIPFPTICKCAK